jgi:4-amino-4-deoxy-L-arabinose transferase-like glycosyltransferase
MRSLLGPAFVALLFVLLQLPDIASYPLVTTDEAFLNDPALQLARAGRFRNDVLSANLGFDGPYFWQPPGLALVQAAIYKLAGFGLWQTRISAILFGGLVCAALYRLVEALTGRPGIALGAALVPVFWPTLLLTAKIARMDTHALFFLLLASLFAVHSLGRDGNRRPMLAGLCLGIAGIFHPVAISWAIGLGLAYAWQARHTPLRVLAMALAAAVLPALWAVAAALNPDAFSGQFMTQIAERSGSNDLAERLFGGAWRYRDEFLRVPLLLPLLLLAVGFGWRTVRASPALCMLLATAAIAFVVTYFGGGPDHGFYQLYPMTALVVVVAGVMPALIARFGRLVMAVTAGVLMASMVFASYAPRALALIAQGPARDYELQFTELTRRLQPGDQVWGTAVAWYAIAAAGARLDAHREDVPVGWRTRPDPARHRFVVMLDEETFPNEGFRRLGAFGQAPRAIRGSTFASQDYVYEIWQSTQLP